MIDIDKLEDGAWYDGFVWKDKQQGAATLRWNAESRHFHNPYEERFVAHYRHVDDEPHSRIWRFDPNVISTGEPAS